MAHRRKHHRVHHRVHHRKSHRRHRRMGALDLGGDVGIKLLTVGAGFLLGNTINSMVDKVLPKDPTLVTAPTKNSSTIAAVGMVGIGGLLLMRKKTAGPAGNILAYGGGILAGAGLKRALKVMGVMSGYQSVPVIGRHRMAGYQSVPVIGARKTPAQLAGNIPAQLRGYIPAGSGVGGYIPAGSGVRGVMGAIGNCDGYSGSGINNSGSGYLS